MSTGANSEPISTPQRKKPGRPWKYGDFLRHLQDDQLYTPAAIARTGLAAGLLPTENLSDEERKKLRTKIRHTLARATKNHHFPEAGDGIVTLQGQPPQRGWLGRRWKALISS